MTQPGGSADDVRRPSGASGEVRPEQSAAPSGDLDDLLETAQEREPAHVAPGSRAGVAGLVHDVRVQVAAGVVAALVLGLVLGGLLFGGQDAAPAAAAVAPTSGVPATSAPVPTGPVTPEANAPEPVSIRIPTLAIDQKMIPLGVTEERSLEVPEQWMDIGYWETGPAPGEAGGAVIAGHVNGDGAPAVFAELPTLEVGDEVDVLRADGSIASFAVRTKEQFAKDDFPNERMYTFAGPSFLHLVTCGGTFDTRSGHYDDNIVVFAELVGIRPAPA